MSLVLLILLNQALPYLMNKIDSAFSLTLIGLSGVSLGALIGYLLDQKPNPKNPIKARPEPNYTELQRLIIDEIRHIDLKESDCASYFLDVIGVQEKLTNSLEIEIEASS